MSALTAPRPEPTPASLPAREGLRALAHSRWLLLVPAVLAVATWAAFLANRAPGTAAARTGFPLDDAWIHLVYTRSLATTGRFDYNPGMPETGMTSPLWVVLLAGAYLVASPLGTAAVVLGAKALALAFGILGSLAMRSLALTLGLSPWAALLAAGLFAIDPSLTFTRAAGMEVPLVTFLILLALVSAIRGRPIAAAVVTGLAIVTRPEAAMIVPGVALLLARDARTHGVARLGLAAAIAAIPPLLYMGFCLYATGQPLPNTYYAKFTASNPLNAAVIAFGWTQYVHGNLPYFTLEAGSILAITGAGCMLRWAATRAAAVLGAGVLLFTGTLASRAFAPGHYHYWERWLVPSFPFLLLAMVAGAECLWRFRPPAARRAGSALAGLAVLALLFALPGRLAERAAAFAWNCQNIDEINVALGRWVAAHVPEGDVVAVNDAGALRYFGNRTTVDLVGLNDHRVRRVLAEGKGPEYLRTRGVRWFVIFPTWYPGIVEAMKLERVHEASAPHYTICDAPQDRMVVYRWPRAPG